MFSSEKAEREERACQGCWLSPQGAVGVERFVWWQGLDSFFFSFCCLFSCIFWAICSWPSQLPMHDKLPVVGCKKKLRFLLVTFFFLGTMYLARGLFHRVFFYADLHMELSDQSNGEEFRGVSSSCALRSVHSAQVVDCGWLRWHASQSVRGRTIVVFVGFYRFVNSYNYNTLDKVSAWEAHQDYIRAVAVHPTQPFLLSSSDDMLIKLWDWDKVSKRNKTKEAKRYALLCWILFLIPLNFVSLNSMLHF
jgi:hypothetical protein